MVDLSFGTFLAPSLLPLYEASAETVGKRLGLSTEVVVETSYDRCVADVNEACFVCSLPYLTFERQGLSPATPAVAPVLTGDRYEGRPIYFSDVIVSTDSQARSFGDLRGASWAYNEPLSQSGYGITRYHLLTLGETSGFFGDVVEAGFHEKAIWMVAEGLVDASAIDSHVLAIEIRRHPELTRRIRVIDHLGPSTIQPLAISNRVPSEVRAGITTALTSMHHDPKGAAALADAGVERYVPVGPNSYDDIRRMLAACEEAEFMELR